MALMSHREPLLGKNLYVSTFDFRLPLGRPHRLVVAWRHRGPGPSGRCFGEANHWPEVPQPAVRRGALQDEV